MLSCALGKNAIHRLSPYQPTSHRRVSDYDTISVHYLLHNSHLNRLQIAAAGATICRFSDDTVLQVTFLVFYLTENRYRILVVVLI